MTRSRLLIHATRLQTQRRSAMPRLGAASALRKPGPVRPVAAGGSRGAED